jgi:hypothetical protein
MSTTEIEEIVYADPFTPVRVHPVERRPVHHSEP